MVFSQTGSWNYKDSVQWGKIVQEKVSNYDVINILNFEKAEYLSDNPGIPCVFKSIDLPYSGKISVKLINTSFVKLNEQESNVLPGDIFFPEQINPEAHIVFERGLPKAEIYFFPFRNSNHGIEKLTHYELTISLEPKLETFSSFYTEKTERESSNSALSSGRWYKIGITNTGIHKISKSFLNTLGLKTDEIDPRNIRLFGNGGQQLPEKNSDYYPDDLMENAIFIAGETDGKFDENDYLLFYGMGSTSWRYDPLKSVFRHSKNIYADTAWYFITTDLGPGKRISNQESFNGISSIQVTDYDDFKFIENDEENVLKSGRRWVGNKMEILDNYSFSFSFPDITQGPHKLISNLVARNVTPSQGGGFPESAMGVAINGQNFTQTIPKLNGAGYLDTYCKENESTFSFSGTNSNITINISKLNPTSTAWIDYLILNVKRNLKFSGSQLPFRNQSATGTGKISEFILSNANQNILIWDLTNPYEIKNQEYSLNGNLLSFKSETSVLKEYIALNPGGTFPFPIPAGSIANQNLHGTEAVDLVIVCPPIFSNAGKRLAEHHRTQDNMKVSLVSPQEIYNEFSSGKQDIAGIRNYLKMLYNKTTTSGAGLKYLLLIGDGSYDPKNRIKNNTNFIPTYESAESFSPIGSYASDDFYGLLDPDEGSNIGSSGAGKLDIGIGRLPVSNSAEADAVADKIIHYSTSRSTLNDWRNIICFVSDDEDNNDHLEQAEAVSGIIQNNHPEFNIEKIYLDAYQQISGSGGQRYPQVNADIENRISRGSLIMNYAGHGGEQSLALERVITIPDINGWKNKDNLTFFITATCEFSRFDNPEFTSAGEYVILNPDGAGVGLLSTTRLTFSSSNKALNLNVMDTIIGKMNNRHLTLGETMQIAKNQTGSSVNNRSFALLGDPAMTLAFPTYEVVTTHINDKPVGESADTINALQLVNVKGFVSDGTGPMTTFNGVVFPTVFDKPTNAVTLSNDGQNSPARKFNIQRNVIFKGPVSVKNGYFSFSFVVPQDIKFNLDKGKISYYARQNESMKDANGSFNNITIGGHAKNPILDDQGPDIKLFMNTDKFISGGITNENPDLLAYIEDDIGINTAGTGIGHDITAVLDGKSNDPIVLNDFYEAEKDDFTKGSIRYPFKNLTPGRHTLTVKVWDIANNSSEATIDFVVVKSSEINITQVMNYPNPFNTNTQFFFEHNQAGVSLEVDINIFSMSGKLAKTIQTNIQTEGFTSESISWDGTDDYGNKLAKGIYFYRVGVQTHDGKRAEKFEKLVIFN